jgi:integrase
MPALKRFKTKYPGIYYVMGKSVSGKPEKIYYMRYRKDGKLVEDKAGRQHQDDMTPARAAQKRERRISGKELSNQGKREAEEAIKQAEEARWTIDKLWKEYKAGRKPGKSLHTDTLRYEKYLEAPFGKKEPQELVALDVDRIRIKLLKKLSPQTVKHVLNLLTWIVNFGVKKNLCEGFSFHVQKPTVNNLTTEDLSAEQMKALLKAIEDYSNVQIKNLMLMALYTGMRRGELFKLKWADINFERGFISIVDPKGGPDQKIPLNTAARKILENHPRPRFKVRGSKKKHIESPFVFPGRGGQQRVSCQASVNEIKKNAGLPKDFRPMHGLRHVYASMLASSGEVDMYVLQKLLTHKDGRMTQRYAHLRDEALKKASQVAGDILTGIAAEKDKVLKLTDKK